MSEILIHAPVFGAGWHMASSMYAEKIHLIPDQKKQKEFLDIDVDGERWFWDGRIYYPDVARMGRTFGGLGEAPPAQEWVAADAALALKSSPEWHQRRRS